MFRTAYREIGLFGLVKRTVNEFLEDDMPTYASALAYQMLFSLFPFLLVLITLVGYLHLPEFFAWLREQAALLLPPEAMDQVNPVIDQLQQQKGGLLSIGIAVALWTSSAGIRSMMIALNAACDPATTLDIAHLASPETGRKREAPGTTAATKGPGGDEAAVTPRSNGHCPAKNSSTLADEALSRPSPAPAQPGPGSGASWPGRRSAGNSSRAHA